MRGRERHGASSKGKRSPTPQQDPSLLVRSQTAPILSFGSDELERSRTPSQRAKTPQPGVHFDDPSESGSPSEDDSESRLALAEAYFREGVSQLIDAKPNTRVNSFNSLARILRTTYLGPETLEHNIETLSECISKAVEHGSINEKISASAMCEVLAASLGVTPDFFDNVSTSFHSACVGALGNNTSVTLPSALVRAYATLCYCCSDDPAATEECMDVLKRVFIEPNEGISEYTIAAAAASWAMLASTVTLDTDDTGDVAERFVDICSESENVDVRMEVFLALGVLFENVRDSITTAGGEDDDEDDEDELVDCRGSAGGKGGRGRKKKMPTLYDCPGWVDPDVIETFQKESAIRAAKKDKAMELKAYRIVSSVLLEGEEPEPVVVGVAHKKLVFEGLTKRLVFSGLKRIFEDGINTHLKENGLVMDILDYEFEAVLTHAYSADAVKKADLKRKKDRDIRHDSFFNYDD